MSPITRIVVTTDDGSEYEIAPLGACWKVRRCKDMRWVLYNDMPTALLTLLYGNVEWEDD